VFDSGTDAARKAAGKSVPNLLLMKKKFFFRFQIFSFVSNSLFLPRHGGVVACFLHCELCCVPSSSKHPF
jgi:hypothetical protein